MVQQEIKGHIFSPHDSLVAARNNGAIVGEVAAANQTYGISGAATSVLNQNGYIVTEDDAGQFYVNKMYNSNPGNPNYFDQNLDLMPFQNTNASYPTYNQDTSIINSYAQNAQKISNDYITGLGSAQSANQSTNTDGFTISDKTDSLKSYEVIDPVTGKIVSKEKSEAIDDLLADRATVNKFENIAKKINKTYDAQNGKADGKDFDITHNVSEGVGVVAGAALGGKIGLAAGSVFGPVGTVVGGIAGALIGGVAGFFAGDATADKISSYTEPKEIANDLESSLNGLSQEEKVAFDRYYYETYGQKIGNTLSMLEVDEDSSWEAQMSGLTNYKINGILVGFDSASKNVLEFAEGEKDQLEAEEKAQEESTASADDNNSTKNTHSMSEITKYNLNKSEYNYLMDAASKIRGGRSTVEDYNLPDGCSTLDDIEAKLITLADEIEAYNAQ